MKAPDYRQALIDKVDFPVVQCEVTTKFAKTAYLTAGDGYPVVCLHGAGAGAVTWYPSMGTIAKNFHVVVPDILGYGESDKPDAPYDRPYFSAWLKDFLDTLGITKAHVVGLSQGGAIALQFALENPQMVDKLVLVDSGALGAQPSFWPMLGMIWLNIFPSAAANRFNSRYLMFNPKNRDPNHSHYSIEVLKKPGGKNAFTQGKGAAVSAMSEEALGEIQNQTLIIWGEDDLLFSIEHAEAAVQMIPNARLLRISDAGHLPMMDQTEIFNRSITDFLSAEEGANV